MKRAIWISSLSLGAIAAVGLRVGMSSASARPARGAEAHLETGLGRAGSTDSEAVVRRLSERDAQQARRRAKVEERIRKMPDLTQTDPALGVTGGGEAWCGPVAVSNALMWLSEQGRETLVPAAGDPRQRQLELVRGLGSGRYMGTTPNGGTGTSNLLVGLHKYLRDTRWGYRRLEYQGWRGHPVRFSTGVKVAQTSFIARGLDEGGVAMIHAGWYTPGRYGGDFHRRHGGHWLTVVGAGIDENGNDAPDTLVVHDPAPYAGAAPNRHFIKLEPLDHGWLIAEDGAFPAKGFWRMAGGMRIKVPGDMAVLDGAVVLVL